jgi:hypothetical protein
MSIKQLSKQDIQNAFDRAHERYRVSSLAQRNPSPQSAGSTFLRAMTWEELRALDWLPFNDPDVLDPIISFRAALPGYLGIAPLATMNASSHVILRPAHKGEHRIKEGLEAGELATECVADLSTVEGRRVEFSTLLLRPTSEAGVDVWDVVTFYPGPAAFFFPIVSMREVQLYFESDNPTVTCTASQAIELGFTHCKHSISLT